MLEKARHKEAEDTEMYNNKGIVHNKKKKLRLYDSMLSQGHISLTLTRSVNSIE